MIALALLPGTLTPSCAAPPVASATPSPPAPFDFAAPPLPLPGAAVSREKQLVNLLKGFEPVQKADALLTPAPEGRCALQVVLRLRRGRHLSQDTLRSMVSVITGFLADLDPARLNIAGSDGRMLVAAGQAQPPDENAPVNPLALYGGVAVALGAVIAAAGAYRLRRKRRPPPHAPFTAHPDQLALWLRTERPEVAGLALSALAGPAARRLERALRARRVEIRPPVAAPSPAAQRLALEALQERACSPEARTP